MGRATAEDLASNGMFPMETMLLTHLRHNHYPPVNEVFIPVAMEAIIRAQDQDYDSILDLEKITGKSGFRKPMMTVSELMEGLHLWDFVPGDSEYDIEIEEESRCNL